jgi:hypothetical protein
MRELDSNFRRKTQQGTSQPAEVSGILKCYYNKGVVPRQLEIRDLVLKKDIRTKDKHKLSSPWEGPFIVEDIAAPGDYVLVEVDGGMLPSIWNVDQLSKFYA